MTALSKAQVKALDLLQFERVNIHWRGRWRRSVSVPDGVKIPWAIRPLDKLERLGLCWINAYGTTRWYELTDAGRAELARRETP